MAVVECDEEDPFSTTDECVAFRGSLINKNGHKAQPLDDYVNCDNNQAVSW